MKAQLDMHIGSLAISGWQKMQGKTEDAMRTLFLETAWKRAPHTAFEYFAIPTDASLHGHEI